MLSLASKLLNLAVSEGLKFKIFMGEGPQTHLCDALRVLAPLLGQRDVRAIAPP